MDIEFTYNEESITETDLLSIIDTSKDYVLNIVSSYELNDSSLVTSIHWTFNVIGNF